MPKRLIVLFLGIALFFSFIFFSYLVHKNLFTQLDFNTTVHLQDHIPRRLDGPFSFLSEIGQFEVMTVVLAAIFLIVRKIKVGIIAFGFYISFHLIEIYGKYFVHHPPPPGFMLRTINLIPPSPFDIRTQNSYPSGHAGRALFVSVVLLIFIWQAKRFGLLTKSILTLSIIAYDFLMLMSRVYLGEHWFSDIIGGSLLGGAMGLFAGIFLVDTKQQGHGEEKHKSLFPKYKIEVKRVE
jgi:undecaprenyl-diphosphatase